MQIWLGWVRSVTIGWPTLCRRLSSFLIVRIWATSTISLGVTYANTVLIGIPLVLSSFGDEGLGTTLTIISVNGLTLFTMVALTGVSSGERTTSLLSAHHIHLQKSHYHWVAARCRGQPAGHSHFRAAARSRCSSRAGRSLMCALYSWRVTGHRQQHVVGRGSQSGRAHVPAEALDYPGACLSLQRAWFSS